jgi:hypothetical protein
MLQASSVVALPEDAEDGRWDMQVTNENEVEAATLAAAMRTVRREGSMVVKGEEERESVKSRECGSK